MPGTDISAKTKAFIARCIPSIGQLEVLLLLEQSAPKSWTGEEVAKALFIKEDWARGFLLDLELNALLVQGPDAQFVYAPRNDAHREAVIELRTAFSERRVSITSLIYSQANSNAQAFADSFRIKRKTDD